MSVDGLPWFPMLLGGCVLGSALGDYNGSGLGFWCGPAGRAYLQASHFLLSVLWLLNNMILI